jgi:lysophospholipase L1-like esterase
LARYQAANAALPPVAPGKPRIVFMGDSITENWAKNRPAFFEQTGYIGRGIGGQTTQQMILRMHQDVVNIKASVVLILAGTNDVAENTGPMTDEQIIDNLATMTEIARANGVKVVVGSVPPATTFFWRRDMTPAPRIRELNEKLKAWAKSKQFVYADFWAAMSLPDGGMKPDLASDTVHPNDAGYGVMEPIAIAAVNQALKAK